MHTTPFARIADLIADPANAWSIGTSGASGEFMRDPDEPATIERTDDTIQIATARGAIRVAGSHPGVAARSPALALHAPADPAGDCTIAALGPDLDAIRPIDRDALLFDLGVATGCVRMCARTTDAALIDALNAAIGQELLSVSGIMPAFLAAQPHRVMLSPVARIEVYQPIPPVDGTSPVGPHTHLLPALIATDRPVTTGWQPALAMHSHANEGHSA